MPNGLILLKVFFSQTFWFSLWLCVFYIVQLLTTEFQISSREGSLSKWFMEEDEDEVEAASSKLDTELLCGLKNKYLNHGWSWEAVLHTVYLVNCYAYYLPGKLFCILSTWQDVLHTLTQINPEKLNIHLHGWSKTILRQDVIILFLIHKNLFYLNLLRILLVFIWWLHNQFCSHDELDGWFHVVCDSRLPQWPVFLP